jgi:hypothetical protein
MSDPKTIDEKMKSEQELLQWKQAASPNKPVMMREERRICKSKREKAADEAMKLQLNHTRRARRRCVHSGQGRLDSGLPETLSRVRVK